MFKNKDNFTDVVENLPKAKPAPAPKPEQSKPAEQQVVSSSGETITLAQNEARKK